MELIQKSKEEGEQFIVDLLKQEIASSVKDKFILGIPGGAGQIRLDVARRLDRADDAWTYRLGFTIER